MATKKEKWTMPEWMERYRELFVNTGGNSIEYLMNCDVDSRSNEVLSVLKLSVDSQIILLMRMRKAGILL